MATVPLGQRITFDVIGDTKGWTPTSVNGVRGVALDNLSPFFTVHDVVVNNRDVRFLGGVFGDSGQYWDWPYAAVVTVTTRQSYAKIQDADSIVANAFYKATGAVPTVTARTFEPGQEREKDASPFGTWALVAVVGLVALAIVLVRVKP